MSELVVDIAGTKSDLVTVKPSPDKVVVGSLTSSTPIKVETIPEEEKVAGDALKEAMEKVAEKVTKGQSKVRTKAE